MLKPDGKRLRIKEPGSLFILAAKKVDQGMYVCMATNPLGQKKSNSATLTVKGIHSFLSTTPNFRSDLPCALNDA